ncbi:MAG: VanZ family protein [Candidatus Omnitrophica bacterium]|nr:VanZ family protein [Candidatus Omnitrophota bacterium]
MCAAAIAVGALIPIPPAKAAGPPWLDKLLHVCEYALFAWCLVRAARASGMPRSRTLALAFVLSVGYGMLLEGLQAWLPYRAAEWGDLAANLIGTGLSLVWSIRS